eukprot:scaffold699_cov385-Prasinococcus_capsulatus_cf.AAC.18
MGPRRSPQHRWTKLAPTIPFIECGQEGPHSISEILLRKLLLRKGFICIGLGPTVKRRLKQFVVEQMIQCIHHAPMLGQR